MNPNPLYDLGDKLVAATHGLHLWDISHRRADFMAVKIDFGPNSRLVANHARIIIAYNNPHPELEYGIVAVFPHYCAEKRMVSILHEAGHYFGRHDRSSRDTVAEEAHAWRWAMEYMKQANQELSYSAREYIGYGFSSYLATYGIRKSANIHWMVEYGIPLYTQPGDYYYQDPRETTYWARLDDVKAELLTILPKQERQDFITDTKPFYLEKHKPFKDY